VTHRPSHAPTLRKPSDGSLDTKKCMGELVGGASTAGDKDASLSLSASLDNAEVGVAALQALIEPELTRSSLSPILWLQLQ
jgi:hypothetical protein